MGDELPENKSDDALPKQSRFPPPAASPTHTRITDLLNAIFPATCPLTWSDGAACLEAIIETYGLKGHAGAQPRRSSDQEVPDAEARLLQMGRQVSAMTQPPA